MTPSRHHRRPATAGALAAVLAATLVLSLAACGNTPPTAPPATQTPAPTAPPTASPTPSATASPLVSIVPVPTSIAATPEPTSSAHLDPATAAKLQQVLDGLTAASKTPGSVAAVVFPDGSIWTGQSGSAILSSRTATTADTLFAVGSISKTFVAALAGRLAQRGTIGLDDKLSRYVPAFPNAANISLRQLLNHTSGIQDLFVAKGMAAAILSNPSRIWTADEVLARIGKPSFLPGQNYGYSNTDYVLLGLALERATGETLASQIRSEFLGPLGLDHTFLQTQEHAAGPFAHGYMDVKGNTATPRDVSAGQSMLPFNSEASVAGPAGAYVSTASDLARWASALYGGGVLDDATLASMVDTSPTLAYKVKPKYPYGLGFEKTLVAGRTAWGHRGHLDGFWSAMEYLPDAHVTVVVLANAQWANDPLAWSGQLVSVLLGPTLLGPTLLGPTLPGPSLPGPSPTH